MKNSLTRVLNKNIQVEWVYTFVILSLLIFILINNELTQNTSVFSLLLFALFFSIYMLYQINIKRKVYSKLKHLFELTNDQQKLGANQDNLQYFELNKILDHLCDSYKNEELHRSDIEAKNKELRQIIDLVPHKIFAKDAQGKFIFVNKATALSYGLSTEQMQGKSHYELHNNSEIFPVSEVQEFIKDDLEVMTSNTVKFIPEEQNHEIDGSVKIMQTTKMPFKSSTSDDLAMLGIAIDITQEKARQKELESNYQELKKHSIKIDHLNLELEEFQHEIVHVMLDMLEIHDSYTKGHSENVAKICKAMAIELNLSDEDVKHAYWAGILHDIGKTVVPKAILNKEGKLTEEEFSLIQNHSTWGYSVLIKSKQLHKIADYVLYHHERWDAKGYPQGLVAEEIPLISQILSIADFWDAMTSRRSYHKPLSEQDALLEIKECSGKQFNPEIVKLFLAMKEKENNAKPIDCA